jgi:glycosyltransferase involved in cell wall biosynthesis
MLDEKDGSMKYSVIICYRNREKHLEILVPRLKEVFQDYAEIIVVEQNDDDRFLRGNAFNAGAQIAQGEILVFHDVDHYPRGCHAAYDYYLPPEGVDVWLPIKRVVYVDNQLKELPLEDVPSGYRHFKDGVDSDFFGGVEVFQREAFFKINGFNSLYKGWGLEDADLRERIKHNNLVVKRGNGDFYALQHTDSFPGLENEDFQLNQRIFAQWENYLEAGVNTQMQTTENAMFHGWGGYRHGVDRWVKVTNFMTVGNEWEPFTSVDNLTCYYEDEPEKHRNIWLTCKDLVNEYPLLKEHREWVIANDFGYGNRSLHWMWNLIIKDLPHNFKFLEIGVYKGQIISLASLLSQHHKKEGTVFGITPLDATGDKFSKHPVIDYENAIATIYAQFGLTGDDLNIIEGLSNDKAVLEAAKENSPYDVIYIDGCHDYPVVKKDVENYTNMVCLGGLLVMDDASSYLNIPDNLIRMNWKGIVDVSNAARDTIEKDDRFEHLFAVGHNRVWQRIK